MKDQTELIFQDSVHTRVYTTHKVKPGMMDVIRNVDVKMYLKEFTPVLKGNECTPVHKGNEFTPAHKGNEFTHVLKGNECTPVHKGNEFTQR